MHVHFDINKILKSSQASSCLQGLTVILIIKKSFLLNLTDQHPLYGSLEKIYNLESLDYFQTGILYFDTSDYR